MTTHLLGYLDLNSLLNLRATNKHFRSIVRLHRLTSLSVSGNEETVEEDFDHFFYTGEPIKASPSFVTTNSNFFRSRIMKSLLERLKRLHADVLPSEESKSSFNVNLNLNHLKSLEVLQINTLKNRKGGCLSLPNLLVLNIDRLTDNTLELETPKLFAFKSNTRLEKFIFKFPETITHFGLSCFSYSWSFSNHYYSFPNLQYLYVKNSVPLSFFGNLENSKLKEVHFFTMNQVDLQNMLTNGGAEAKKIKVFSFGIQIKDADELGELFADVDKATVTDLTRLYAIYYDRLSDRMPWVKQIEYSALVSMFNDLPPDLHHKFYRISAVSVSQPVGQAKFVSFLTKCKTVRKLSLKNAAFDRSFFVGLIDCCPYLKDLCIEEHAESINLGCFVTKLENLERLSIDQEVSFHKMNQILIHFSLDDENRSCQLEYFEFKFRNKTCVVQCDQGYQVLLDGQLARFNDRKAMFNVLKIISRCK